MRTCCPWVATASMDLSPRIWIRAPINHQRYNSGRLPVYWVEKKDKLGLTDLWGYIAWKISWMEEPGALQSVGSLRVGHNWATSLSLFTFMYWRRKWQPTPAFLPVFLPSMGSQSQTRLKRLSSSSRQLVANCIRLKLSSFPFTILHSLNFCIL